MHSLPTACPLVLLSSSAAYAQSKHPSTSSSKGVGTRALGQYDEYLHARITTLDYARTCLQMAREPVKFLDDEAKRRMRAK
jgi:hypothetical protein